MGQLLSYVWGWWSPSNQNLPLEEDLGPNPDEADPTTGLTARQRAAVRSTWNVVKPDLKTHSVNFFLFLFEEHPVLQTRFKKLDGLSKEELRVSKKMAAHGSSVFLAITGLVDNLEDVSVLVEMLKTTGYNHIRRQIPKSDFELLAPVLLKFLENNLGPHWTETAEKGWKQVLTALMAVVTSAYENPNDAD